ncbi:uncharacterized protein LODBEIA_P60030 [Lodderomyces beijingensis]|uniref:Redoxin domain-containing protein n=1 Tax=Lodderomyces beijingensis TaxID=1775926 RepID=A0ABP0ZV14_9ASCO
MPLENSLPFPTDVKFLYIPIDIRDTEAINPLKCEQPLTLRVDSLISKLAHSYRHDTNLLIVSVPGAWTPMCGEHHIPPFLLNLEKLKHLHVGAIVIIGTNDPFVMSGWGKTLVKEYVESGTDIFAMPRLFFANDVGFSKEHGLTVEVGGFLRNKRYAMLIDCKDRRIKYFGVETERKIDKSGLDAVLARL